MFFDRSYRCGNYGCRRDRGIATHRTRRVVRRDVAAKMETTTSPRVATLSSTGESQSGSTSVPVVTATSSASSSSASNATRNGTIMAIVLAVVCALALGGLFKLHYNWRRRAARRRREAQRRNSTFVQHVLHIDAAPARASVVPRDELLPPPTKPPEWDARSSATCSTAATFDSPITASEPAHGRRVGRSVDEKLRDIFYHAHAPAPAPYPRSSASFVPSLSSASFFPSFSSTSFVPSLSSASFVPSLSSPTSTSMSTPPFSPPPPAVRTPLPSLALKSSAFPQAWSNPPPSPVYPSRPPGQLQTLRTSLIPAESHMLPTPPAYSREAPDVDTRPPSYSRH